MSDEEITAPCGQRPPRNIREMFFQRCAERNCGFETPCWVWLWRVDRDGYGQFNPESRNGREQRAHRWAHELFIGPVPKGLHVHHRCSNRACVNPAHLEAVTCRENLMRGDTAAARLSAKTHCLRGHPFDAENTWIDPKSGSRQCRACNRARQRRYRASKVAA